ncbi:MAG TPA: hypothetical protein VMM79_13125, partial [Longimicrobiales bacterium]|nr:hypothetical protein [Longimicrobiales bacterium]
STRPTSVAPRGTLRYVETDPSSGRPVAKLLTSGSAGGEDVIGLTNVDSVKRQTFEEAPDIITIYDRHPVTGALISASDTDIAVAIAEIEALGSDIQAVAGGFSDDFLQDTTYVAASGDRSTIAFGEGDTGTSPGRIFLCCASDGTNVSLTSTPIHIKDLVDNAAESVSGLALDWTGAYGVARGRETAYFFTADGTLTTPLRLQGEFRSGISGGAGGVAMHPGLSGVLSGDQERRLAFVATGNRTIKIIDSVHFYERGEIAIRDNVVGPIRAVFPTAEERNRFTGDERIVVKLIAVTAGDNVVIIDVRAGDIRQ